MPLNSTVDKAKPDSSTSSSYNGWFTSNFQLYMPDKTDYVRVSDLNYNFEIIDKNMGEGSKWKASPEEWDPDKVYEKQEIGQDSDNEPIYSNAAIVVKHANVVWRLNAPKATTGVPPSEEDGVWEQLSWASTKDQLLTKELKRDANNTCRTPPLFLKVPAHGAFSNAVPTIQSTMGITRGGSLSPTSQGDDKATPVIDIMGLSATTSICSIRLFKLDTEPTSVSTQSALASSIGTIDLDYPNDSLLLSYFSYTDEDYPGTSKWLSHISTLSLGRDRIVIAQTDALYKGLPVGDSQSRPNNELIFTPRSINLSMYNGPIKIAAGTNSYGSVKTLSAIKNSYENFHISFLDNVLFLDPQGKVRRITNYDNIPQNEDFEIDLENITDYDVFSELYSAYIELTCGNYSLIVSSTGIFAKKDGNTPVALYSSP